MTAPKRNWLAVTAVVALLAGAAPAVAGDELECRAILNGAQEVPPVVTDTTGRADVDFNEDRTSAEFKLRVFDGFEVTQAHIHCGAAGVNGPVVAFLAGLFGGNTSQDVDGTWIDEATLTVDSVIPRPDSDACPGGVSSIEDIANQALADRAYVNVHTKANPGGEVRGQLVCEED